MNKLRSTISNLVTKIRIIWLKYWEFQRRFAFDRSRVSFRMALTYFVGVLLVIYFVIGLPTFGYLIYGKHVEGVPLAIAANLYPFPVAVVGNDIILLKPYSDRLDYIQFFAKQTNEKVPTGTDLRNQVTNELIDEAVIRQWANKAGINVTNSDINNAYAQIIKQQGSANDVATVLSQLYNLNEAEFKRLIPDYLYRQKVQDQIIDQVHVKHILVSNQDLANKIKGEVTIDNFNSEAKQYSEDTTTMDKGGDLGWLNQDQVNQLDPALEKAFFSATPEQISGPVQSKYGWHVFVVLEKKGSYDGDFTQWLNDVRSQTKIRRILN